MTDPQNISVLSVLSFLVLISCQGVILSTPTPPDIPQTEGVGEMRVIQGDFAYRLGGLDASGTPSARVFVSRRNEAGTLGPWSETVSLPQGRSFSSVFIVASTAGNLIYVLGGEGPSGLSASVFFTFIQQDGALGFNSPGKWEISSRSLPEPRSRAGGALYDGRIFLLGGLLKEGKTSSILQGRLNQDGQLGQWYVSPQILPFPQYGVTPAIQEARLYAAGDGEVFSFSLGDFGLLEDLRFETALPQTQETPLVAPGSGMVTTNAPVQVLSPPGSTLRFREDSQEVTLSDPIWDPAYRIKSDCVLSMRAFSFDHVPSPQVYRKYRTRKSSFLVMVEPDYLPIQSPGNLTLGTLVLQETQSLNLKIPQNSAWFRLSLYGPEKLKLLWADNQTNSEYTGSIELTLFEENLYTEVLDRRGKPVTNYGSLDLNRGQYYFQVRDKNGALGRSFGLGISRE